MKKLPYLITLILLAASFNTCQKKAPAVSSLNTQEYSQSILQNSEKDIVFIENLGQITDTEGEKRPDILFLTRSESVDMYMTNSGITYVFRKTESDVNDQFLSALSKNTEKQSVSSYFRLDMEFVGMNKDITIKKELAVDQQFHYYTPEYPNGISPRAYKKVTMENIYEGIDLVYYEKEGRMKYDFILKAGADAGKIKMKYKGAGSMNIDNHGNVIITTPMGEIREEKPYTYSRDTGSEIESRYRLKNNTILFDIAEYDKSEVIIIDPIRLWATFYGGSAGDWGNGICTDNSGNLYVTGETASSDFPAQTLTGAYNQTTVGGGSDAYILKFNSNGERIWATYYGGSLSDQGWGICTDNLGDLYVTGQTSSTDFPVLTLAGAYNKDTLDGPGDAFILKFNSSGASIWATYYGGNGDEYGVDICTDTSDNLYVVGWTRSSDFPTQTLTGAYNQTTHGGGWWDPFILKFNGSGERIWATYYGGGRSDWGNSICTDNFGNLYVTGGTLSWNFPTQTLTGAYNQTTMSGGTWCGDVFILKFNSSCVRQWATYYGGGGDDEGWGICTDDSGHLYVTGYARGNFPTQTLTGAYNQTFGGGWCDAYILKFNSSGVRIWATYYGGGGDDEGWGISTDNSGNLYVVGWTPSIDFPTQTLTGAYNQTTLGGSSDSFILQFNSSCVRQWATYYGGSDDEGGWDLRRSGICTNNSGNLYVTGHTESSNFPTQTLTGAYNQSTSGGGYDAFILRFEVLYAAFSASDDTICEGDTISFTNLSTDNVISWDWTFEGGEPETSTEENPIVVYTSAGSFDVELSVSDGSETAELLMEDYINVDTYPDPEIEGADVVCDFQEEEYATVLVDGNEYSWEVTGGNIIDGEGTNMITVAWGGEGIGLIVLTELNGFSCISFDSLEILIDDCTGIEEIGIENIKISSNPFTTSTTLSYELHQPEKVSLCIYNHLGQIIYQTEEQQPQGKQQLIWNAEGYADGIYYYRLQVGDTIANGKMVKVR